MAHPSTSPALHASELVKTYPGGRGAPRLRALDGLSFDAAAGTIFGLLGPNGAGKSTTVKILATLTRADSGSASVAGIDVAKHPDAVRRAIGFVAQKQVSDPMDTGLENLVLAGRLQGMTGRDAKARATERNSGSTAGRALFSFGPRPSVTCGRPPSFTSRCRSGRAT